MDVADTIRELGGVAQLDVLRTRGIGRADVLEARRAGHVDRVRRAWYAAPDADPAAVAAVRIGGALTCVSAAAAHGLWQVPDDRIHIALAGNAARLRPLDEGPPPGEDPRLVLHWRERTWCPTRALQSIDDVLRHVVECQPLPLAVAVIDSALRTGVARGVLDDWLSQSASGARAMRFADGRAEAGGESIARVRLRQAGYVVHPQFQLPGVGRIDMRVGERLLVEIDSRSHHAREREMASDRRRDRAALQLGFVPLRFMHLEVLHDWDAVQAVVDEFTRTDRHRRRVPTPAAQRRG